MDFAEDCREYRFSIGEVENNLYHSRNMRHTVPKIRSKVQLDVLVCSVFSSISLLCCFCSSPQKVLRLVNFNKLQKRRMQNTRQLRRRHFNYYIVTQVPTNSLGADFVVLTNILTDNIKH